MNVTINVRHVSISDAMRQYAAEKAAKLERYFDKITTVDIVMDTDGGIPFVEVVVTATKNHTFIGTHRGQDVFGCVDNALHKVEEQLRRHKDKVRDHKGPSHEQITGQVSASEPREEQA